MPIADFTPLSTFQSINISHFASRFFNAAFESLNLHRELNRCPPADAVLSKSDSIFGMA